jgi:hypothetical protein
MRLSVSNFLSRFYDVIDKKTNKKIDFVQFADDKTGIYHTYKFESRHKNIGIRMNIENYFLFIKKGNIELTGKNKFFRLIKKVSDLLIK